MNVRPSRFALSETRRIHVSFEFFPPQTEEMEKILWESIERLAPLAPDFVSVTYGAGGSTRERTHATVKRILAETPLTPAAHLTCVAATRDEIDDIVRNYHNVGVRHIVALRGDSISGPGTQYAPHPGGYKNAADLVGGIKRNCPDIEVSVSAYPEKHPDSPTVDADIDMLKAKVDAGADARDDAVLLRERPLLPLSRPRACARHQYPDRAGHPAGAELQGGEEFRRPRRRHRAGVGWPSASTASITIRPRAS